MKIEELSCSCCGKKLTSPYLRKENKTFCNQECLNYRRKVVVIVSSRFFHFTSTKLQRDDLWFPYNGNKDELFVIVENALTINRVARNVTSITKIRETKDVSDFEVIFNGIES